MKVDSILHLLLAGLCVLAVSESAFAGASGGPPPAVAEQVLYKFCSLGGCTDGSNPSTGLIMDGSGNLYGTTEFGGSHHEGTVFKLAPSGAGWAETTLYSFCAQGGSLCTDGELPLSALIMDGSGNLYGTTVNGGSHGPGAVYRLTPNGTETVIYSFCAQGGSACTDGANPIAGLIMDASGNLYGTTLGGGSHNGGTVYRLAPNGIGWDEAVLYSFCAQGGTACTDGLRAYAALIMDGSGNLYGTTEFGGSHSAGTVFKLAPTMTGWVETVLYSFCALGGNACTDGGLPLSALIMDGAGNLYGTTDAGGTNGGGVAFRIAPNGTETVLYSFCALGGSACTDGTDPLAGLIMDPAGNLYGAAELGGSHSKGAVYKIAPSGSGWTETVLYSFCSQSSCVDGANPAASLLMDVAGNLYGTTVNGGNDFCGPNNTSPCGTVFQLTGLGSTLSVSIIGNPGGRVTSSPSGINCGSTCSASFAIGTPVTLTATPSGWNFGGWSGACTGSGSCAVTMNSNQAVTATFWTNGSVVPYPSPAGAPQVSGVPSPAPATP